MTKEYWQGFGADLATYEEEGKALAKLPLVQ